jgi:hypothetical protein
MSQKVFATLSPNGGWDKFWNDRMVSSWYSFSYEPYNLSFNDSVRSKDRGFSDDLSIICFYDSTDYVY